MGMSGLYVGLSGLRTSSNSLNTTANNLTNVNTEGYVRQQVVYKDMSYNAVTTTSSTTTGQKGLGVTTATINHVRDIFLDAAYRKENGRQAFYDKLYDATYEIETQMGEADGIEGIAFQKKITDLLESINEVAKTPTDPTARAGLAQSSVAFIAAAQSIYKGLSDYQTTLNNEVITTVNRINEIGDKIMDLNRQIIKIETGGVENAADLRDQRDVLLDELSGYCNISYEETEVGSVEVSIDGVPFADNISVNHMGMETISGSDFINPVWTNMSNQSVYNLDRTISTENNTDIGGLKGLLVARGTITPTYQDLTAPDVADYEGGASNADYLIALDRYNRYAGSSTISSVVNTMGNFDKLVTSIVTGINDILCPETTVTDADGNEYTVLDTDKASQSGDGDYGIELFTRNFCNRYTKQTINGTDYYVRNNTNYFNNEASYTIMNITVNDAILQDYSKLPLTNSKGEEDFITAGKLVSLFQTDSMVYNNGLDEMTFEEFYETLTGDIANTGKIYSNMADSESALANELNNKRQQVMGVSSDEELGNMIKFQQAYNAASRYINVVSEMMESLINSLGAG